MEDDGNLERKKHKYHAFLLSETRIFDGKTYYFLRKSLRFTQNIAERKAEEIRNKGDFARVIIGSYRGNPSYRVYFRYSDLNNPKKILKKKRKLRRK